MKNDPQYPSVRDYFLGLNNAESAVFSNSQVLIFLTSISMCAIFYLVCNRIWKMNYRWAWILALVVTGSICFGISYFQVGSYVYFYPDPIEAAGWKFIGFSVFWGCFYFYILSLFFKNVSIFAKNIPHSTKLKK